VKVVAWSDMKNTITVRSGDTASIDFVIRNDDDVDLTVTQIVALGYDDIADVHGPGDLPAKIFSKMHADYQDYQRLKAERDQLSELVVEQAAEIERLRLLDGRKWRLMRRP
jgi:ribosomal protein S10